MEGKIRGNNRRGRIMFNRFTTHTHTCVVINHHLPCEAIKALPGGNFARFMYLLRTLSNFMCILKNPPLRASAKLFAVVVGLN